MIDAKTERKPCGCGSPDCHDIPEITDWSKAIPNPHAGRRKDGYTIVIEHENFNEIIDIKKSWEDKEGNPLIEKPKTTMEVISND